MGEFEFSGSSNQQKKEKLNANQLSDIKSIFKIHNESFLTKKQTLIHLLSFVDEKNNLQFGILDALLNAHSNAKIFYL